MTHSYNITGLTCNGCVDKAVKALEAIPGVSTASVQLAAPQATISMERHISLEVLQDALLRKGKFHISESVTTIHEEATKPDTVSWWQTYKPLLLIFSYIIVIALLTSFPATRFEGMIFMRHFMAGFFLVFSFFKFLDLAGFADSYATYDIIGKKWRNWGFVYAFLELLLGVLFLTDFLPLWTNVFTVVLMTVSLVGVLQSVMNKRKIQCACLGVVFNLPMSTVTIVEDALMIGMSLLTLVTMNL